MSPTGMSFPSPTAGRVDRKYMSPHRLEELLDTDVKTGEDLTHFLEQFASDPSHRLLAKKIRPYLGEVNVILEKKAFDEISEAGALGQYVYPDVYSASAIDTITIRSRRVTAQNPRQFPHGTDAETLLHEALHAATARRLLDAELSTNKGTALHKAAQDLEYLWKEVVEATSLRLVDDGSLSPKLRHILEKSNALLERDELISWGLTNREFREYLKTVKVRSGKSALTEFVEKMMELLGLTTKEERNALLTLIEKTDNLLEAPLWETHQVATKVLPDPDAVSRADGLMPPLDLSDLKSWIRGQ
jgi:hypothetical protein